MGLDFMNFKTNYTPSIGLLAVMTSGYGGGVPSSWIWYNAAANPGD